MTVVSPKTRSTLGTWWTKFGALTRDRRLILILTPLGFILGGACTAVGGWLWNEKIEPKAYYLTISASDADPPHAPLPDATVAIHLPHGGYLSSKTDRLGAVGFTIPHEDGNSTVTPTVALDGYDTGKIPSIELREHNVESHLLLARFKALTSSAAPEPPTAVTNEVYRSDNLPSGAGADLSPLYTLCSQPKPLGWTIVSSTFSLEGDRSCGAWASCSPHPDNNAERVCYSFRTQGHSEEVGVFRGGNTGIHYSTGVLTVAWRHPASETFK